jgi:hypothetical protein
MICRWISFLLVSFWFFNAIVQINASPLMTPADTKMVCTMFSSFFMPNNHPLPNSIKFKPNDDGNSSPREPKNNNNKQPTSGNGITNGISSSQEEGTNGSGIWGAFQRFVSPFTRAKLLKSFDLPATDDEMHYHLRLKDRVGATDSARHIITRIMRYFPDIPYDTAKQIVMRTRDEGVALIRVLHTLSDARDAVELFRRADPPIVCEIYDAKKDEIIPS